MVIQSSLTKIPSATFNDVISEGLTTNSRRMKNKLRSLRTWLSTLNLSSPNKSTWTQLRCATPTTEAEDVQGLLEVEEATQLEVVDSLSTNLVQEVQQRDQFLKYVEEPATRL